jgi:GntR family transcriptional regulator/MocR family aminotransferase
MEQAVLQLINDGTIKRHLKKATHFYKAKGISQPNCLKSI